MKDNLPLKIALGIILGVIGLVVLGFLCSCVLVFLAGQSIGPSTSKVPFANPSPTELPTLDIGATFKIPSTDISISLSEWKESSIAIEGPYSGNRFYAFTAKPGMKFIILIFKFRNDGVRAQQTPYLSEGEIQTGQGFFYKVWHSPAGISSDDYKPRAATDSDIKKLVGDSAAFVNLLPHQESSFGRVVFEIPKDGKPIEAIIKTLPVRIRFSGNPSP